MPSSLQRQHRTEFVGSIVLIGLVIVFSFGPPFYWWLQGDHSLRIRAFGTFIGAGGVVAYMVVASGIGFFLIRRRMRRSTSLKLRRDELRK